MFIDNLKLDAQDIKVMLKFKLDRGTFICYNKYILQGYSCPACQTGGCSYWQKTDELLRWYK